MNDKTVVKAIIGFERSDKDFVSFWERLDITIEDLLKSSSINANATVSQMFKIIKAEPELYALLPENLHIDAAYVLSPRKRNEILKEIFKANMKIILNAYFCVLFAKNFQYASVWEENNVLNSREVSNINDNFAARAFLTYQRDKSKLNDVYNSVVMLMNEQQKYRIIIRPTLNGPIYISGNEFEKLWNKYEKSRRNHRNKIKVWWEKDKGDEYNLVFRRSLSKRIRIRLFNKNKFIGAADTKTITLKKDLSEVGLYTKNHKDLTLKFLTRFLKQETNAEEITLEPSPFFLRKTNADKLIERLLKNRGNGIRLVEVTVRNFPVRTNPEVKIKAIAADGIEEALADFESKSITLDKDDIRNIKVRYRDRDFILKPESKGANIEFSVTGKGVHGHIKNEFLRELENVSRAR